MTSRRRFTATLLASTVVAAAPSAWAANEPPIHVLVGFPAGGGSDVIARLLAERLEKELGRSVLVENRPGAGGQIAAQLLKAAKPDGTTVFLSHDHTISILPQVVKKPGYAPHEDFTPLGGFATFVNGLAGRRARRPSRWRSMCNGSSRRAARARSASRHRPRRPSSWCS